MTEDCDQTTEYYGYDSYTSTYLRCEDSCTNFE